MTRSKIDVVLVNGEPAPRCTCGWVGFPCRTVAAARSWGPEHQKYCRGVRKAKLNPKPPVPEST